MKTIRRLLKWLLMFMAALLVAAIGSWWLIPDASLHPDVESLLAKPAPPPADQNAYFLLWGFRATDGLNPQVTGQRIVAEHENMVAAQADLSAFKPERFLGAHPLELSLKTRRCDIDQQNCLRFYQRAQADVLADTEKFATALDRYRSLRSYAQFSERVMSPTMQSPHPEYAMVAGLSGLVDAQTALLAAAPGSRKVALEMLGAEVRTWRRILQGSDTLITNMVATAALHRKYRLASEIMQAYPGVVAEFPAQMAAITSPLSGDGFNLRRLLEGEFRYAAHFHRSLRQQMARADTQRNVFDTSLNFLIAAGGYKPHATLNQAYAMHREIVQLYAKSPADMLSEHAALAARQGDVNFWNPATIFRNPIGKALLGAGIYDYANYAFRLYDLAGYSRLVELQRRIIEAKVAPERIPVLLGNVGLGLMDPYTSQAMAWNPVKKTLSFAGHGERFLTEGRATVEVGSH